MTGISELLQTLRAERDRIEGLLAQLSDEQMEAPNVNGGWSVKDIIAHLTIWERRGTQWIAWARESLQTGQVQHAGYSAKDVDRLNAEHYQQNKDRPLQAVLDEFRQVFPALIEQVEAINEDDLDMVVQADWTDHQLVTIRDVVRWRYWHYRYHVSEIEAKVESKKP